MARPKTIASTYHRTHIRIPKELFRLLKARALMKEVALNTEIIQTLRRGLRLPRQVLRAEQED